MPIITIPASEIRKGDILTLTVPASEIRKGDILTLTVPGVPVNAPLSTMILVGSADGRLTGSLWVEPTMLARVERSDPEADLIDVMAAAYWAVDGAGDWSEVPEHVREIQRRRIAAALAAARKAGAL